MKRISSVDGTIPLQAHLWVDEEHLASQHAVGLYWGALKAPRHQNGTIHLTSHRLIYVDGQHPARNSLAISLSSVIETEHYSGFLTSSPKVTLFFRDEDQLASGTSLSGPADQQWTCQVCDERNTSGTQCTLCGVPRDAIETPHATTSLASSLPASSSILHSVSPPKTEEIACSACTFLNPTSSTACEICGTALPPNTSSKSAPISRASSPGSQSLDDPDELEISAFKISFRKGGDKAFYSLLKRSLKSKAWAKSGSSPRASTEVNSRAGIHGLLTSMEATSLSQSASLAGAFQDLEAFAIKARDMLELARQFNAKLQTQTQDLEPEEARLVRGSLMSLGLSSTSSATSAIGGGGEEELVQELAAVLQGSRRGGNSLIKDRGIVGLDEVWGAWMRTRGVSLLPPTILPPLLPLLSAYTDPPLFLRSLPGGVNVICTKEWTYDAVSDRILSTIRTREENGDGGITTFEISLGITADASQANDVGISMIASMVEECEANGLIWRDDPHGGGMDEAQTAAGPKWWINICTPGGWQWDGQE